MKNKSTSAPKKSLKKETDVFSFLKAVPFLEKMSECNMLCYAEIFAISPETFTLLIYLAINNGRVFYEN